MGHQRSPPMGVADRDVGVPTAPISAKTSSCWMRLRVLAMAASGLVGVVLGHKLQLPSVNAAVQVGLVEGGLYPCHHTPAQILGWAAECGGLAKQYALVRDTGP